MKTRDITLIAVLSASLTAGKMLLSFLPNIEIVTFLIITYTVLFGFRRSILTTMVFITTEILIYGFGTWLLGYYFIWPSLVFITHLFSKRMKNEYFWGFLAGVYGLLFGLFFAVFESIFYGAAYGIAYWVRGIPFDIMHGVSNFILTMVLFKPVTRQIQKIQTKYIV